jgi:hypothetical protein
MFKDVHITSKQLCNELNDYPTWIIYTCCFLSVSVVLMLKKLKDVFRYEKGTSR